MAFTFRPLTEDDLPLLHRWLNAPHVLEWWGRGHDAAPTLDDVRMTYLPRLDDASRVQSFIALLDREPLGYVQSYTPFGCGDGWWEDETDPGARGMDQLLGEGARLGQGLGTRMVAAFARLLFEDPGVTKIQTDPHPMNVRAIRCYEKVGFCKVATIRTPDGPAVLMVLERAQLRDCEAAPPAASRQPKPGFRT
jgi:aminoglycoside 6'-N-acetyltransferase-1b/aminoglycoside 6'-N-acetyltransferase-2